MIDPISNYQRSLFLLIAILSSFFLSSCRAGFKSDSSLLSSGISNEESVIDEPTQLPIYKGPYYVSLSGKDSNLGTLDSPFASIQVAAKHAKAGETVYVRAGEYNLNQLILTNQGTAERPVVFKNYQNEKVVLNFGLKLDGWKRASSSSSTEPVFEVMPSYNQNHWKNKNHFLFIGDKPHYKVSAMSELGVGKFFTDEDSGLVSVWPSDGLDPRNVETRLINFRSSSGIQNHSADGNQVGAHIILDGFSIVGASSGVRIANPKKLAGKSGFTVRNCEIKHSFFYAIELNNWSDSLIENCEIHNNDLWNFPRGIASTRLRDDGSGRYSTWQKVIIGMYSNRVTVRNSRIHNNHGEGVGPYFGCKDWIIRNNEVYDNYSVNIYIDITEGGAVVDGNRVYSTGKYLDAKYNFPTNHINSRNMAKGIVVANEGADMAPFIDTATPGIDRVTITNNLVYNSNTGIGFLTYSPAPGKPPGPSYFVDSIIANNTLGEMWQGSDGIKVDSGENLLVMNNILYQSSMTLRSKRDGESGVIASHNLLSRSDLLDLGASGVVATRTMYGNPDFCRSGSRPEQAYGVSSTSVALRAGASVLQKASASRIPASTDSLMWDYLGKVRSQTGGFDLGAFIGSQCD